MSLASPLSINAVGSNLRITGALVSTTHQFQCSQLWDQDALLSLHPFEPVSMQAFCLLSKMNKQQTYLTDILDVHGFLGLRNVAHNA